MTEIKRWWASTDPKPKPDGNMVFYSDHLAEVERVEMEELDKHADLTEQFAYKLAAKDVEIKRQHRLRIDAAQAYAKALAKRDEETERLKGDGDEICADCQLPIGRGIGTYWRASDELWKRVVGPNPHPALILCPRCFSGRAQSRGIDLSGWTPGQALPAELEKLAKEIEAMRGHLPIHLAADLCRERATELRGGSDA